MVNLPRFTIHLNTFKQHVGKYMEHMGQPILNQFMHGLWPRLTSSPESNPHCRRRYSDSSSWGSWSQIAPSNHQCCLPHLIPTLVVGSPTHLKNMRKSNWVQICQICWKIFPCFRVENSFKNIWETTTIPLWLYHWIVSPTVRLVQRSRFQKKTWEVPGGYSTHGNPPWFYWKCQVIIENYGSTKSWSDNWSWHESMKRWRWQR